MKIKKQNLLLLAGVIWGFAGIQVTRIGFQSYMPYISIFNLIISSIIFSFFWFLIFSKLVIKHTIRIMNYKENKQLFYKFFDFKSFLIMFIMMGFGIVLRVFSLWPENWIAIFYSGLGIALFLAGIYFLYQYVKHYNQGGLL